MITSKIDVESKENILFLCAKLLRDENNIKFKIYEFGTDFVVESLPLPLLKYANFRLDNSPPSGSSLVSIDSSYAVDGSSMDDGNC